MEKAKKIGVTLVRVGGVLLTLIALETFVMAVCLGIPLFAVTMALFFIGTFPVRWTRWRGIPTIAVSAAVVLLVGGARFNTRQATARFDEMAKRIPNLSATEYMGLYLVSLNLPVGGWVTGYPEVAKEHFYMLFSGPTERVFQSEFPLRAPGVARRLGGFARGIPGKGTEMAPSTMTFSFDRAFRRYALALNPMQLSAIAFRVGEQGWRIRVEGRVPCHYPRHSRVPLLDLFGSTLYFEEGLLWALTERGWLHPYTAVWRFELGTKDPRLSAE